MLLGTFGASLLGNISTGWAINRAIKGCGINRAGEGVIVMRQCRGIVRAGYSNNEMDF